MGILRRQKFLTRVVRYYLPVKMGAYGMEARKSYVFSKSNKK